MYTVDSCPCLSQPMTQSVAMASPISEIGCQPAAPRIPKIFRETTRIPGAPGQVRDVVRRLPTPTPDMIERIVFEQPGQDIINVVYERPSTPPAQVIERRVIEAPPPPIVNCFERRVPYVQKPAFVPAPVTCQAAPLHYQPESYACQPESYACQQAPYAFQQAPYAFQQAPYTCQPAPYTCQPAPFACQSAPFAYQNGPVLSSTYTATYEQYNFSSPDFSVQGGYPGRGFYQPQTCGAPIYGGYYY